MKAPQREGNASFRPGCHVVCTSSFTNLSLSPLLIIFLHSPQKFTVETTQILRERERAIGVLKDSLPLLHRSLMDPCRFVRLVVGNVALKFPTSAAVKPEAPCFCVIKLKNFPTQTATVPLLSPDHRLLPDAHLHSPSACFNLSQADILKLAPSNPRLKISVYSGCPSSVCGLICSGRLLGAVSVPLDLKSAESKPCGFHKGWVSVGDSTAKSQPAAELYLNVRAEPDPRFVFRFSGDPECSPQVLQIQGKFQQPVFTCKFSFRNSVEHNRRELTHSRSWLSSLAAEKNQSGRKERKGWSVTVHDLSGSPVAAASMVTPFVPSPGSDRVSRANPGAWLILRPGSGAWKPWGRLEAWRERGDGLGYRFQLLVSDSSGATGITLAESSLSSKYGGKFTVDDMTTSAANSPFSSPDGSFDLGPVSWSGSGSGSGSWGHFMYRGFVMSATVEGSGSKSSRPEVEVGVEHVSCTEDAAAFVALAAALDLSVDACRPFSQKLRKELRHEEQENVV